jgi:hypothetical protein
MHPKGDPREDQPVIGYDRTDRCTHPGGASVTEQREVISWLSPEGHDGGERSEVPA